MSPAQLSDSSGDRCLGSMPHTHAALPPAASLVLDAAIASLSSWHPYAPPLAPFPADWRSDVPSWLERVCEPDGPPTTTWTWQRLALLRRHASGRVALQAHAAFADASQDRALWQHLVSHAWQCLDSFQDDALENGLTFYTRVTRETLEALIEGIAAHDHACGEQLRQAALRADRHACRHARIEPEPPVRQSVKNLMWTDDHKSLLSGATPLDWWGKYGLVREVLAARDPETEARLRHTAMSMGLP